MMRQVCNRQGHLINPLRMILLLAAMLLFICTVVYRMLKSDSVSNAMAILIESLLIVAFFIFLGIIIAYLLYFIRDRIRQGAKSSPVYGMFGQPSADDKATPKPDRSEMGINSDERAESQLNS
jgi:predicted PurR-regulated permease PerM